MEKCIKFDSWESQASYRLALGPTKPPM